MKELVNKDGTKKEGTDQQYMQVSILKKLIGGGLNTKETRIEVNLPPKYLSHKNLQEEWAITNLNSLGSD